MTPFAIASQGRSGSTMLQHLLDSHPDARCLGEVIAKGSEWQAHYANLTMAEYLSAFVFQDGFRASGFKMMNEFVRDFPDAWDVLQEFGTKLVINRRRNKVDQYLSLLLAQQSSMWSSLHPYPEATLRVDAGNLMVHAAVWTTIDTELEGLAARFPAISVVYEDVRRGEGLEEIQRFLGLEPVVLTTPTVRARKQSRRDLIENLDEVAEALADTPWAGDLFAEE